MIKYQLGFSDEGKEDLDFFPARERRIIVAHVKKQLGSEPLKETRNRKRLRDNLLAPWELRIGRFRVFYQVKEQIVTVVAVGAKEHNQLFIRGKEVEL